VRYETRAARDAGGGLEGLRAVEFLVADAARILEEALALAPSQRARIAHELIDSLGAETGAEQVGKIEAIRAALLEGEQSGIAEDSSLESVLREFRAARLR